MTIQQVAERVIAECLTAITKHGHFASAHEALGVIEEEFIELRDEIFLKEEKRDKERMVREAIQLSAMGLKLAISLEVSGFRGMARERQADRLLQKILSGSLDSNYPELSYELKEAIRAHLAGDIVSVEQELSK